MTASGSPSIAMVVTNRNGAVIAASSPRPSVPRTRARIGAVANDANGIAMFAIADIAM
ncbi:hypothetical protein ACRAWB_09445 [Leifsonia poae]|uniref:hypothetical protein n=1 Tax=Leifsonia poae TaxID=110933 RepID=UPI003D696CD3